MSQNSIAFIGGGNMATSLVGGLIATGRPADTIWITDIDEHKLLAIQERFGVKTTSDNALAVSRAGTVVLAVKPQHMSEAVRSVARQAQQSEPLLVSIAAGVRSVDIERWLGFEAPVVRTMPNTPSLVGEGATGLFANARVSAEQRARAEGILQAVGITVWVDQEKDIDAVTAISGSGPAYFFLVMEAMEDAGVELGLPREVVRRLTLQTALGAARIALEGEDPPALLREKVTSPGGTTEQALAVLRGAGLEETFRAALTAARDRAVELGQELGDS